MIAYDLKCSRGHVFEGWFADEAAFLAQRRQGSIACPVCHDASVERIPSTFAIRNASGAAAPEVPALESALRRMAAFIHDRFEDVGSDFAKEALKIHYGVGAPRNIRGSSTPLEEETLRQEGIEFLKLPLPPAPEPDA